MQDHKLFPEFDPDKISIHELLASQLKKKKKTIFLQQSRLNYIPCDFHTWRIAMMLLFYFHTILLAFYQKSNVFLKPFTNI